MIYILYYLYIKLKFIFYTVCINIKLKLKTAKFIEKISKSNLL